jgi:hypothetical protein
LGNWLCCQEALVFGAGLAVSRSGAALAPYVLGVTADEYVGRHIGKFYVDREVAADVLARLSRREAIREREVQLRRKDGTIKDVLSVQTCSGTVTRSSTLAALR